MLEFFGYLFGFSYPQPSSDDTGDDDLPKAPELIIPEPEGYAERFSQEAQTEALGLPEEPLTDLHTSSEEDSEDEPDPYGEYELEPTEEEEEYPE